MSTIRSGRGIASSPSGGCIGSISVPDVVWKYECTSAPIVSRKAVQCSTSGLYLLHGANTYPAADPIGSRR